jgi:hypothetical protein
MRGGTKLKFHCLSRWARDRAGAQVHVEVGLCEELIVLEGPWLANDVAAATQNVIHQATRNTNIAAVDEHDKIAQNGYSSKNQLSSIAPRPKSGRASAPALRAGCP